LPLLFFATFIGGSVERPQSSFSYDLRTRRKARAAILNIQAGLDAVPLVVYSLTLESLPRLFGAEAR